MFQCVFNNEHKVKSIIFRFLASSMSCSNCMCLAATAAGRLREIVIHLLISLVAANGTDSDAEGKDAPIDNDPIVVVLTLSIRFVEDENGEQDQKNYAYETSANLQSKFDSLVDSTSIIIQSLRKLVTCNHN